MAHLSSGVSYVLCSVQLQIHVQSKMRIRTIVSIILWLGWTPFNTGQYSTGGWHQYGCYPKMVHKNLHATSKSLTCPSCSGLNDPERIILLEPVISALPGQHIDTPPRNISRDNVGRTFLWWHFARWEKPHKNKREIHYLSHSRQQQWGNQKHMQI